MSDILITTGEPQNLNAIMQLIKKVVAYMKTIRMEQWTDQYPSEEIITTDIENGWSYLAWINGKLVGTIALNSQQEPEYASVNWNINRGSHLVVHRLAVDPEFQSYGIGKALMLHAETLAYQQNYSSIRLDTYSANPCSIGFYQKLGYQKTGEVSFHFKPLPYYCYDKLIEHAG